MTSFASNYLNIHLNSDENKKLPHDEYKNIMYCASLLDNIHDFKENISFAELKKAMKSNNLINPTESNLTCSVRDEDKYLENVIGLKRNKMNHWTMGSNKELPTTNILSEYTFINYDDETKENPINRAIKMLFDDIKPNTEINNEKGVPYRNIELVVDTQKGLFDAINNYTHYFNWLDCAATRIDPAGKSNPKTKGDKLTTDNIVVDRVYYNSIQEVLEIPNYDNSNYPNINIEENNTVLFSSNCDITLYTGENHKAYALINPNQNTKKHAKKKYAVPHTFLQKSDKKQQTIAMLRDLLKKLFKTINEASSFKQLKKKETKAKKYTDMHYLMKRFGDAIQALYCGYLQKEGKIPWLVTYDRPLLGHAILYKTPVIVYCNHFRDKKIPGSGLTIAIHKSILSGDAKKQLEEKLKNEKNRQAKNNTEKRNEVTTIKTKNTAFIKKSIEFIKQIQDVFVIPFNNDVPFGNETYKNFLKFLYIHFYKNELYEFVYSLTLLLKDVYHKNNAIDLNNYITLQNEIDKTTVKINKLTEKIKKYSFKDKINNPDRLKMILHGLRGKTGKYKTIVPEGEGRRSKINIGGNSFLIKTKGKLLKMAENVDVNPLSNKLKSIIAIIDKALEQLTKLQTGWNGDGNGEEKEPTSTKRKRYDQNTGQVTKMSRINEDTTYEDIHNLILEHYNEIAIFHKINELIIDNFIEEQVVIENIKENNNSKPSGSGNSKFLTEINYDNSGTLLSKIEAFNTSITPETIANIQDLFNIKHGFETDMDDEYNDNDNDKIWQQLKDRNIFNNEPVLEYEPDIVSSKYNDAIRLYDVLYDYNNKLTTINNTYEEYYNESDKKKTDTVEVISMSDLNESDKKKTDTVEVISMSDLKKLFEPGDVKINNIFPVVLLNAEKSIMELMNVYDNYRVSIKSQEGKHGDYTNHVKDTSNMTKPGILMELDDTPEGKVGAPVIGGKKKHNVRKNNKTKKRTKKLNKTKKKSHKNKKNHNKKRHNKKTKKVRKKRNSKTKIKKKKYKKKKNKKKKQLFEMSIKELRDHVKKKKKH